MVEVSLTVGKLDASLALLLTQDHHLIEFPTILLPNGVQAGSIVKIKCDQDFETEQEEAKQFQQIQNEILDTFGTNLPKEPVLNVKNVTQTSCVLEWDPLDLGTASLKSLFIYKDLTKLGSLPLPLLNRTTKLSGLAIDKTYEFRLVLETTAGTFKSNVLEVTTHKMTDLTGINVCLGEISENEAFTIDDIQNTLKDIGAHYPAQTSVNVDTTHYIASRENKQNSEFIKANEMNIPIIRPEWLKACERDRRIVGVRDFYIKDCSLPDIYAKNYWDKKSERTPELPTESIPLPEEPSIKVTHPTPEKETVEEKLDETVEAESTKEEIKAHTPTPEAVATETITATNPEPEETEPKATEPEEPKEPEKAEVVDLAVDPELVEPVVASEETEEKVGVPEEPEKAEVVDLAVEPELVEPVVAPEVTEPTAVEPEEPEEPEKAEVVDLAVEPELVEPVVAADAEPEVSKEPEVAEKELPEIVEPQSNGTPHEPAIEEAVKPKKKNNKKKKNKK